MALVCAVSMSIEKYFKRSQKKILPSPHGSLSLSVPSRAIAAANKEVGRVLRQQSSASATTISKKRGKYKYSPEERAMIGKHAVLYGNLFFHSGALQRRYITRVETKNDYAEDGGIR